MSELDAIVEQYRQVYLFLVRRNLLLAEDFEQALKGVGMGAAPLGLIGLKLDE